MTGKEAQEALIENMRKWQKVESATISNTAKIMEQSDNLLLRMVMEIIQRDSHAHYRTQQLIIDHYTRNKVEMDPEELANVWDSIEKHIEIERQSVQMAKDSLRAMEASKDVVAEYLLTYLLEDEKKHDKLLSDLDLIKKGMYPYGG